MDWTTVFSIERHGKPAAETWKLLAEMFCPKCGENGVWMKEDGGDYYVGELHICAECGNGFTIQGPRELDDWDDKSLEKLRT